MRVPQVGDIWLVHYPYITPGNMEKIRPALIKRIDDETNVVIVQKMTTKKHFNNRKFEHPKLKKTTFLSTETVKINEYNLIRYIGNMTQVRKK